ncbi:alpha-galactosidase [Liquorilactobacillus sucicola]|uniref:alpha-galactosidase n=1 Tax=Liquorilactobacillus sucicola TaxID=519050 RepID=UPI0006917F35
MIMITYDNCSKTFHLSNSKISYVLKLLNDKYLVKCYLGPKLAAYRGSNKISTSKHAFSIQGDADPYSLTSLPLEYSTLESGDYRIPAYEVKNSANQYLPIMKYKNHKIIDGIPDNMTDLPQLKAVKEDAQTLLIRLADEQNNLICELQYVLFDKLPVIAKSVKYINQGEQPLTIENAASLQLDLTDDEYEMITLQGTHAHEANVFKQKLIQGKNVIASNHGTSGPQAVPFLALTRPGTTQHQGSIISTTLLWSGNFASGVEVDHYHRLRTVIGINPEHFSWELAPGEQYLTPQAILAYTDGGLNGMSNVYHRLFNTHLIPYQRQHLISYNTWETTYFAINEQKAVRQLDAAQKLGVELFVIDDGWFINRNGEDGQLGDWRPDPSKFPHGLTNLSDKAHHCGMKFGLWIEPEMVTANSKVYQNHPDWILQYHDQTPLESRNQLILDLSQSRVQEHIIKLVSNLILDNKLDYLKWDYNRHFSQPGSAVLPAAQQKEVPTRYVLGLYRILKELRIRFPKLIIENCSAGGGRLDPGMLFYTDQTWISDLTDPIYRAEIMQGLSLLYPASIFVSHVTKSPNEQDGRVTSLKTRLLASFLGVTGIECDVQSSTADEQKMIRQYFALYKKNRAIFQNGVLYRLGKLNDSTHSVAWLLTDEQKNNGFILLISGLVSAVKTNRYLPLKYLNNTMLYAVNETEEYLGDELNYAGVTLPISQSDFTSELITINKVN